VISLLITQPLDLLLTRKRYEFYNARLEQHYTGLVSGMLNVIKHEGVLGLYVGILPRFLKKGLGTIFAWSIFDLLNMYGKKVYRNHK